MSHKPLLVNIVGPTAVGKTGLSVRLAEDLATEIVSADSRQIYREMQIGTAVPSEEELARVPHHFIREISVHTPYSAAHYEKDALERIAALHKRYPMVILTGGTGLWIDAVNKGLDDIPGVPSDIREALNRIYEREGLAPLQAELREKDPAYYRQVDLHNPRRLIRALEVIRYTGKPYSSFRKGTPKQRPFRSLWFGLDMPREKLYRRIERRVDDMIAAGLEAEARQLYPYKHLPALQTVGYREWFDYFDGKISREKAVEEIKKNTRRYAKRQWTWFRKNPAVQWVDMQDPDKAFAVIRDAVRSVLP